MSATVKTTPKTKVKAKKCGKKRYRDAVAAKLALAKIRSRDNPKRPKMERRAYPCSDCNGWHLTAKGSKRLGPTIVLARTEEKR